LARWRHKLKAPQENVVPSEEQLTKKAFGLFSTPLDRGGIMAEMKNSTIIYMILAGERSCLERWDGVGHKQRA
jgi:hypothetical protein